MKANRLLEAGLMFQAWAEAHSEALAGLQENVQAYAVLLAKACSPLEELQHLEVLLEQPRDFVESPG
ncbi:MAG TPA: hypothetical protein VFN35_35095 [Ktedonobacteraceae bacterium]|nr:hypothetical protein [Ktedonobacteraceae bacterium]